MPTEVLRVDPARPDPAAVEKAARALREGRLVVFPTETVYGLAARADDPGALASLRQAKGRDAGKPLSVHLPSVAAMAERFSPLPPGAIRLARRRLPGPFTLVIPDPRGGFTGVRVPDDAVARAVLEAAGCPVVATSVNVSGEPPAVTGSGAATLAAGRAAVLLDAGPCRLGRSSTVLRFEGDRVEVLREGAVSREEALEEAARILLFVGTGNLCRSPLAAALAAALLAGRRGCAPGDLPTRGIAVLSAGTHAERGLPATPETLEAARVRGADLSRHRSRPLGPGLLGRADRIFVMEAAQLGSVLGSAPGAAGRLELLDPAGRDVPDPHGPGADAHDRTAALLEEAVAARMAGEA